MQSPFQATKIADGVYWVGAIDWSGRDFHGYQTPRGSTYNAYLIIDDKITLIDTVKAPFRDELLQRIRSVVEPEKIDYIISNHSEMDHTGCLREIIEITNPEKVFASANGKTALLAHFHFPDEQICAVKDGASISLGKMSLEFIETKLVHWPDSMFSFLPERNILFSQDGFGMHMSSSKLFIDELDPAVVNSEQAKYYANILMPFGPQIAKAIDRVVSLQSPVKIIAPDHGALWRKESDIKRIIGKYQDWNSRKTIDKAVIFYDTMWESTDKMARAIADGLISKGVLVELMRLRRSHRSDVVTELLDAKVVVAGSPTLNSNMFPTVADTLCYMKGLRPSHLKGAVFGSYGWSGQAPKQIQEILTEMKIEIIAEPLRIKYVPDRKALLECRKFGETIAKELLVANG